VRRFIFKARAFLYPSPTRPEDPPVPPNYSGAEFAAQEAVDRDPANGERASFCGSPRASAGLHRMRRRPD